MIVAPASTDLDLLTPRERTVAMHVATGMLYAEVARQLGISSETVKVLCHRAAAKLPGPGRPSLKIARYYGLLVGPQPGPL